MKTLISLFLIALTYSSAHAQQTRGQRLDSLYNDPFFFPTVSAIILPKGFVEVNTFASLFSTNQLFTDQARREDLNAQLSQFVNLLQVTYGTSATSRFNIGVDLYYTKLRIDADPNASALGVFGSGEALVSEGAFTQAGIRMRWKPMARDRNLLIQAGVYVPIYKPTESQNRVQIQVIRVYELGRKLFLYAQPGLTYSLPKKAIGGNVSLPLTALVQYQLRTRLGLVGLLNHTIGLNKNAEGVFGQTNWSTQIGAGVQFQPSLRLGFNAFMTQYLAGKNSGVFRTVNLGVRVII